MLKGNSKRRSSTPAFPFSEDHYAMIAHNLRILLNNSQQALLQLREPSSNLWSSSSSVDGSSSIVEKEERHHHNSVLRSRTMNHDTDEEQHVDCKCNACAGETSALRRSRHSLKKTIDAVLLTCEEADSDTFPTILDDEDF